MEYNVYKSNTIGSLNGKTIKYILLFLVSIYGSFTFSQSKIGFNDKTPFKVISYGEKIAFGDIETGTTWTVTNSKEAVFVSLTGNQINEYSFEKPGNYEITYSQNKKHIEGECNHAQFNEKMIIEVSPIKMTFDFSKITFSTKIQKGQNCDGIFITVPVNVVMKNNVPTKFTIPNVNVAGIGVNLIAKPINEQVTLTNGIQFLKYQLSGTVNKETYLMFDFVDVNNNVQTYNQPEIVN